MANFIPGNRPATTIVTDPVTVTEPQPQITTTNPSTNLTPSGAQPTGNEPPIQPSPTLDTVQPQATPTEPPAQTPVTPATPIIPALTTPSSPEQDLELLTNLGRGNTETIISTFTVTPDLVPQYQGAQTGDQIGLTDKGNKVYLGTGEVNLTLPTGYTLNADKNQILDQNGNAVASIINGVIRDMNTGAMIGKTTIGAGDKVLSSDAQNSNLALTLSEKNYQQKQIATTSLNDYASQRALSTSDYYGLIKSGLDPNVLVTAGADIDSVNQAINKINTQIQAAKSQWDSASPSQRQEMLTNPESVFYNPALASAFSDINRFADENNISPSDYTALVKAGINIDLLKQAYPGNDAVFDKLQKQVEALKKLDAYTDMVTLPQITRQGQPAERTPSINVANYIKANPTQAGIQTLKDAGFDDKTIKAAQEYVDLSKSGTSDIEKVLAGKDELSGEISAIISAISNAGYYKPELTKLNISAAGVTQTETDKQIAQKQWDALDTNQKAIVSGLYANDAYKGNYFAEYVKQMGEIAQAGGIAGAIAYSPILPILSPIAKATTGQAVSGQEIATGVAIGAVNYLTLGGGALISKPVEAGLRYGAGAIFGIDTATNWNDNSLAGKILSIAGTAAMFAPEIFGVINKSSETLKPVLVRLHQDQRGFIALNLATTERRLNVELGNSGKQELVQLSSQYLRNASELTPIQINRLNFLLSEGTGNALDNLTLNDVAMLRDLASQGSRATSSQLLRATSPIKARLETGELAELPAEAKELGFVTNDELKNIFIESNGNESEFLKLARELNDKRASEFTNTLVDSFKNKQVKNQEFQKLLDDIENSSTENASAKLLDKMREDVYILENPESPVPRPLSENLAEEAALASAEESYGSFLKDALKESKLAELAENVKTGEMSFADYQTAIEFIAKYFDIPVSKVFQLNNVEELISLALVNNPKKFAKSIERLSEEEKKSVLKGLSDEILNALKSGNSIALLAGVKNLEKQKAEAKALSLTSTRTQSLIKPQLDTKLETKLQTQTQTKTDTKVKTDTTTKTDTDRMKARGFTVKTKSQSNKEKGISTRQYPITVQYPGKYWTTFYPPYRQGNIKMTNEPPSGAKRVDGIGGAYQTIQALGGNADVVLTISSGAQDFEINKPTTKPGTPGAIKFIQDKHDTKPTQLTLKGVKLS